MGECAAKSERVVENLNRALHFLFETDPRVLLIGEDVLDPYGGAFKVCKNLSSKYTERVLGSPVSEEAMLGVAGGLALCGEKPIVEIMFGDFVALGFDQILNFSTKSVSMYGRKLDLSLVIRCPVGGNRGYGPTHSQSLQKHFLGIPNLDLFEVSPFHDNVELLKKLTNLGNPCMLFEEKTLYPQSMLLGGMIDSLFRFEYLGVNNDFARIFSDAYEKTDCLIITSGGMTSRCLEAARELFIDFEIATEIIVAQQLYPFPLDPILELLESAAHIFIVEQSVAGGTWGGEVAQSIYDRLWSKLKNRIRLVHSKNSVIPTAAHLEARVLVQKEDIYAAVKEAALAVPATIPSSRKAEAPSYESHFAGETILAEV
jgi:pyruvate/2-oxoglutarate/acetoin dehydrogenase E1 component